MHEGAEDEVHDPQRFVFPVLVVVSRNARIDHYTVRQKVGVLSHEEQDKDPVEVTVGELVDEKVDDEEGEEDEEGLDLVPAALVLLIVGTDPYHQEVSHHERLEADPDLLYDPPDASMVFLIVGVLYTNLDFCCHKIFFLSLYIILN